MRDGPGAPQALEARKRLLDRQVRKIAARGLQKLMRSFPGPPPFRRRVTEETQDRLAERRGEVHRPAVGAHHAVAQRQGRDQTGKLLGWTRKQGKPAAVFDHSPRLAVISRMPRVVRFAGRPEEQDSRGVLLRDGFDESRKVFRRPLLVSSPRADVYAHDRCAPSQTGKRLLYAATRLRIGKHPGGGRRTVDAESLEQAEHALYLVRRRGWIVRQGDVQPQMSLAGLGIAEQVTRADKSRESHGTRLEPWSRQDRVVEPLPSQPHDQPEPGGVDRQERARAAAVLCLFVRVDGVNRGIPGENRLVVGVDQRRDMGARKALAQRKYERGGADQIADVVAADHQDARTRRLVSRRGG